MMFDRKDPSGQGRRFYGQRSGVEGRSSVEIVKSRGREMENVRDGRMEPLPKQLLLLRERSFLVFVSNLPATISKAELEAMFCRAGKIVDIFIPVDHDS